MKRKLTLAILISLTSPAALALGIGEAEVSSSLNAPLRATVPLNDTRGLDPRQLHVSLAEERAFEQAGLIRSLTARGITFSVEPHQGELAVVMRSERPIRDPYLDLLLDIDWPGGRQLRQVTLLLDPPDYQDRPVLVAAGRSSAAPVTTRASASTLPDTASRQARAAQVEVRSGDTLWELASRLRPDNSISINQMMLALVQTNPSVFPTGNINEMRAGATLNVPTRDMIEQRPGAEADRAVASQSEAWAARDNTATDEAPSVAEPDGSNLAQAPVRDASLAMPGSGASNGADGNAQSPRLTLLSDTELAGEGVASPSRNSTTSGSLAGGEGNAQQVALTAASAVEHDARLLRLESELLTSQQALQQVEEEREALQADVQAMREEMATLREQVTTLLAQREGVVAGQTTSEAMTRRAPWWASFTQMARDNAMMLGGVAAAMLLALWALVRRRQARETQANRAQDFSDGPRVVSVPIVKRGAQQTGSTDAKTGGHKSTEKAPARETMPQAEAISEADIFIAYGRFDQARELLETSLEAEPERHDLRLKLLSVHLEQKSLEAARNEAERLYQVGDAVLSREVQRLMDASRAGESGIDEQRDPQSDTGREEPIIPLSMPAAAELTLDEPGTMESNDERHEASLDIPKESSRPRAFLDDREPAVIDYRPPTLEPDAAVPEETPMQPSIEFVSSGDGWSQQDDMSTPEEEAEALFSAPPGKMVQEEEPQWEIEEVAFEPVHLDNKTSAVASREGSR